MSTASQSSSPRRARHGDQPAQTRVAIIGTGLAGLTTAYLLQNDEQQRYVVTLFEQAPSLAFDSASVTVKNVETGLVERIDLPMRSIAAGYYANLVRMYQHLRIPTHATRFLFVFAEALAATWSTTPTVIDPGTYFVHASNLHQMPPPWPGERSWPYHLAEILYLIVAQLWFTVACFFIPPVHKPSKLSRDRTVVESFGEYTQRIRLPRRYLTRYLVPMMCSVSTCSHDEILAFPASDVIGYKKLSHGEQHYTVCGGVSQVQSRLVEGVKDIRLSARVIEVATGSGSDGLRVRWQSTADGSGKIAEEGFDRVVLATSPDVVSRLFNPLRSVLGKLPTRRVESTVFDPSVVDKGPVKFVLDDTANDQNICSLCSNEASTKPPSLVLTFKTLFNKSGSGQTDALQTMPNGVVVKNSPLEGETECQGALHTSRFTRTLRDPESRALMESILNESRTQEKHVANNENHESWVNGQDGVWLAGAWCWDGMVLLEGCVVSAMRIAHDFGVPSSCVVACQKLFQRARSTNPRRRDTFFCDSLYRFSRASIMGEVSAESRAFVAGFFGGILVAVGLAALVSLVTLWRSDPYGLGHWKLNLETPLKSMWMNVGYWKDEQGQAITNLPQASASLLREVISSSGILEKNRKDVPSGQLAILDLGFGCGDQTWELVRLTQSAKWPSFRYVGLSLNQAQVQFAQWKVHRELAALPESHTVDAKSVQLFCANAAKPNTWTAEVVKSVNALADDVFTERWLLALDCIYHFSPSRKPILKHAAGKLKANYMAFDLMLSDSASFRNVLIARTIGVMMGCPMRTFVREKEYREQLVECGYHDGSIEVREITEHVFPGLVDFISRQDVALGKYAIPMGGFKLAQRIFRWFSASGVIRAVIVTARLKEDTE
ncbi:hypothetical protein HJFPF1_11118 [Paramyrothecium foliicola]|nr:hypothetical protein HJFPF1_11118 [Paramyrothecium foliicola]